MTQETQWTPETSHPRHLSVDPDGLRAVARQLDALADRLAAVATARTDLRQVSPAGRDEVSAAVAGAFSATAELAGDEMAAGVCNLRALGAALSGHGRTFEDAESEGAASITGSRGPR